MTRGIPKASQKRTNLAPLMEDRMSKQPEARTDRRREGRRKGEGEEGGGGGGRDGKEEISQKRRREKRGEGRKGKEK